MSQQWIVDSEFQIEANRLSYIRNNRAQLRADLYSGLKDYINTRASESGLRAGTSIILPSSFEGSPRNIRQHCNDAMAIVAKYGSIDLFITVTANPRWKEIQLNLLPGETASDRPDLVARVFKLKSDAILKDISQKHLFGKCLAYVYTIELKKRGLPHAHIVIVLDENDKFNTLEDNDRVVSAEISNAHEESRLYEIVTRCMIHGPCGSLNPQSPCMQNGECKKNSQSHFNNKQ